MNYLQHNKNQLPHTGPVMPKNMAEGIKTGSQATLQHQQHPQQTKGGR